MSADIEALLATVREALELVGPANEYTSAQIEQEREALAALDSLTAELERREQSIALLNVEVAQSQSELERLREAYEREGTLACDEGVRRFKAEAELERVKAERERLREWIMVNPDAALLEARLDKALAALREARDESEAAASRWREQAKKAKAEGSVSHMCGERDMPSHVLLECRAQSWDGAEKMLAAAIAEIEGEATPRAITGDSDFGKILYEDAEGKPFDPQPIREDLP